MNAVYNNMYFIVTICAGRGDQNAPRYQLKNVKENYVEILLDAKSWKDFKYLNIGYSTTNIF